jgi:ABC-type branched-subunit amino acid transport system substrate-binding protein
VYLCAHGDGPDGLDLDKVGKESIVRVDKRGTWRLVAVVGLAATSLAACGSSHSTSSSSTSAPPTSATIPPPPKVTGTISGPGVTATTITVGQITTTSGPVPGLFQDANDGLDAYAQYVNANGGIDGRKLKVIHADDAFDCNTYTQQLKSMSTKAFAMVGAITLNDTCGQAVLKAHPDLLDLQALVLSPVLYSVPNVFSPTPTPPGYSTTGYEWFKAKFPNDITHTGTLIGGPAEANAKEQMITAESLGYKYVYQRVIGPIETNFTADILRMKREGVKIVDMGAVQVGTVADFLQQARQQNFHFDALISAPGYDAHLLKLIGDPADANNILYAPLPYAMYLGTDRATVPAVNTFLTWLDKAHPGESGSIYNVSAWGAGMLLVQAMAGAGSSVTPATVIKSLDGITSFDSGGLTAEFNPGQRIGAHCQLIAGVQNGAWKRIDPSSGFLCNGTFNNVPLSALK